MAGFAACVTGLLTTGFAQSQKEGQKDGLQPPVFFDFEAPAFKPGNIHGQSAWSVDQGKAEIVVGAGRDGSAGLVLSPADPFSQARLSFKPVGIPAAAIVDLYVSPVAGTLDKKEEMLDIDSARVGLFRRPDQAAASLWVFHGDGQGGGAWLETGARFPVDAKTGQAKSWHRLTIQESLKDNFWDLWVDGVWTATELGFQDDRTPEVPVCIFMGDHSQPVIVDDIGVWSWNPLLETQSNPAETGAKENNGKNDPPNKRLAVVAAPPARPIKPVSDADADGLPDKWERAHGLSPEDPEDPEDINADPDKDGLVNRDEFALGLDPQVADRISDHLPPPTTSVFSRVHNPTVRRGKTVNSRRPSDQAD